MSEKQNAFILIEFVDDQVKFDIRTDNNDQIITALLGLEGYLASQTGLDAEDIRQILDETKEQVVVKPKEPMDDIVDVEVE